MYSVLPPTNRGRSLSAYCAYDGNGNTFDTANLVLGEGATYEGTSYESWAEIPQERARLLALVQESMNAGNAKQVIFISGDQHWAEVMRKEIPARIDQPSVTVYEVTGSGINQDWPYNIANSNRLRPDEAPFPGIKSITYSNADKTCSGDDLHFCSADANYGGIEVDWANEEVHLSIYTPFESVQEAARVTIDL